MSKELQRKVYEGDVIQSVKVVGVTFKADVETVQSFNAACENLRRALANLKDAVRMAIWQRPDEKNVIDQE